MGKRISKIIKYSLSVFIISLIGLPPFFRGLIFEQEMGIHHYLVAMVSVLVAVLLIGESFNVNSWLTRNSYPRPGNADGLANERHHLLVRCLVTSPYFWALAVLTALYGLSLGQAINSRAGLFTWLRHIDYLLTFVLIFLAAGKWEKDRQQAVFVRYLLTVFAFAGTAVAAVGILAGQGIVSIDGGLAYGRLASTFLYPNSMAGYLMATLLMAIFLAVQNPRPLKAGVLAGMSFLTFLAILGSQSRGVWVILPFILALLILGQRARKKIILLTSVILGLAIILANLTVTPQVQQLQPNWGAFLWTLAGCLISGIAWGSCVIWLPQRMFKRRKKIAITGIICTFLIFIVGAVLVSHYSTGVHATSISGNPLLNRLMHIKVVDSNFQSRLVYATDALSMVKDRPLLGWGGGGWQSGYLAYQSFNYLSTTVHNHFLQIWVEAGTLGLIMFIVPFLFLLRGLWRLYQIRTTHILAPETWTIGTAALALGLHSVIDFDLSFSSIALLLWALWALFAHREAFLGIGFRPFKHIRFVQEPRGSLGAQRKGAAGLTVLLSLFLSLASICLAVSTFTLRAAEAEAKACAIAAQKGDGKAALEHIQAARRWDRWSAQYPIMQAQLLMHNIEANPDQQAKEALVYESLILVCRAVELDSYNSDNRFLLARLYLAGGQLEEALQVANQAKVLKPWFIKTYEEFNSIYICVAVQQLLRGQEEAAANTLSRVLTVTREAMTKKDTLSPRLTSLWDSHSELTLTPALALIAGQAALLLEDYTQAMSFLARACRADDPNAQTIAQLWLGVARQKSGDLSGVDLQQKARRASPEAESAYVLLKQLVSW